MLPFDDRVVAREALRLEPRVIPLPLDELEALGLGELVRGAVADRSTGFQIDSRRVAARRSLRRHSRRASRSSTTRRDRGAHDARSRRRVRGDGAFVGEVLRAASGARFVGITGSTGKTSTKDILAALCAPVARTVATEGELQRRARRAADASAGSSRTLRSASWRWACAASARSRELCKIARPDIGVITAVGPVHLELVGSVDGVARSKAELVAALPEDGIAIVPTSADLEPHLRDDIDVRRVGAGRRRAARRRRTRRVRRHARPVPAHLTPPGAERAHCDDGVRGAGPAARATARERRDGARCRRGGGRSCRCPAAASSSTTPTTPTRPRWRRRSDTWQSAAPAAAASRYSAEWRSSASTPTGTTGRSRSWRPSSRSR